MKFHHAIFIAMKFLWPCLPCMSQRQSFSTAWPCTWILMSFRMWKWRRQDQFVNRGILFAMERGGPIPERTIAHRIHVWYTYLIEMSYMSILAGLAQCSLHLGPAVAACCTSCSCAVWALCLQLVAMQCCGGDTVGFQTSRWKWEEMGNWDVERNMSGIVTYIFNL